MGVRIAKDLAKKKSNQMTDQRVLPKQNCEQLENCQKNNIGQKEKESNVEFAFLPTAKTEIKIVPFLKKKSCFDKIENKQFLYNGGTKCAEYEFLKIKNANNQ